MSKQLKLLSDLQQTLTDLQQVVTFWDKGVWPPAKLVEQIAAEATRAREKPPAPSAGKRKTKQRKRAGESDNDTKIVAALTKYHEYGNGRCLNYEPIIGKKLAELAGVTTVAVTRFFQKYFGADGSKDYKRLCLSREGLDRKLQILNREDPKERLYGSDPDQRHYSD